MASGKQPITRHPLFPATVALWFGALFSLGSLAVRPALIESAIVALKLDTIIGVPMGTTTRILIALALAGAGGLLGASLARRIGRPKPSARTRKRGVRFADDGAENAAGLADTEVATSPGVRPGRRNQLAIPDNAHGEVEHYDRAPVPGTMPILNVSQFGIEGFEPEKQPTENQDSAAAISTAAESTDDAAFLPGPAYFETSAAATSSAAPETADNDVTASPTLPRLGNDEEESTKADIASPLFNRAPESGLFAQPFNAEVSEIRWQDDDARADRQPGDEPFDITPDAAASEDASAAERIASARLDDLAPIELLERLAISLRQKRSRAILAASEISVETSPVAESPVNEAANLDLENEAKELEAEQLAIAPVALSSPAIPATLRPIALEPEDDDDALPGYIPPRRIGGAMQTYSAPSAPSSTGETNRSDTTDAADLNEGYSSLLNLSRPTPQGQVSSQAAAPIDATHEAELQYAGSAEGASDTAPESAADGASGWPAGSCDSEETERALRSALASIQRMSGAA